MTGLINEEAINCVKQDNCFDALRYFFAFSLIAVHFATITDIPQFWSVSGGMRVKAFFVITGFLVTYSLLRRKGDIKSYFVKRIVRIMPAYLVCIAFCFFLGMLLTEYSIGEWLRDIQTWKYLASNILMLNWFEPCLPGVFCENVLPQMNGSLWSMKFEMLFYLVLPAIIFLLERWSKHAILLLVPTIILSYLVLPWQLKCFMFFFSGAITLLYFDVFCRHSKAICLTSLLLTAPLYLGLEGTVANVLLCIEPFTFAAILLFIAYNTPVLNFLRRFDNISYGLYLYHFPVVQTLLALHITDSIPLLFGLTLSITILLALLSWYAIEKPLLSRVN